jgi:chaperonin GroES
MALRPLRDKVVVKPSEGEEKSAGGIFLPDTAKKKPQEGKVIAIGTGRVLEDGTVRPLTVQVGDTVVYAKYGGTEVTLEGTDYVLLDEDQIYAIVQA